MTTTDWREVNRAHWDERVPIHLRSTLYDVAGFKAGRLALQPEHVRDLGPVAGKRLVHLQCHFGMETMSWARLGATATGLDFSAPAIAAARELAAELGLPTNFVQADIYDAPAALKAEFDIVYTGVGALMWHPDMDRWAAIVAKLLRPGGELYLNEFHPVEWIFAEATLEVKYDYFTSAEGLAFVLPGSYADTTATTTRDATRQWNHSLGAVVTALIRAGLVIRELSESDGSVLQRWPMLERSADRYWRMPKHLPNLPLMYTVRASKP
jgi:SAM-dependent methyltransferase